MYNCMYWSESNPHKIIQEEVNLSGVTVWCGISSHRIIGLYGFDRIVSDESYLDMLDNWLLLQIDLTVRQFVQDDEATVNYARDVGDWLGQHFPDALIGGRGLVD